MRYLVALETLRESPRIDPCCDPNSFNEKPQLASQQDVGARRRASARNEQTIHAIVSVLMNRMIQFGAHVLVCCGMTLAAQWTAHAADGLEGVTAVSSRASKDYIRAKLKDGSFQPETYAFGKGGKWAGNFSDLSIDKLNFMDVARAIAGPLASQKYVASHDPRATKLLIMVYWGTTKAPEHGSSSDAYVRASAASGGMKGRPIILRIPTGISSSKVMLISKPAVSSDLDSGMMAAMAQVEMENLQRDKVNQQDAAMLGYESWWVATEHFEHVGFGLDFERQDMIDELERARYFVVLEAYDFQMLWRQKKHKLLWEARFSVDQHHNAFDQALPVMTQYASPYFGQDTHGLLRTRIREGHVDIGEVRSLGTIPEN
jgi:hypothetical protein